MPVATREPKMDLPIIITDSEGDQTSSAKSFTFKQATAPAKEYHYMQRIVGPRAMPDGTITGEQLEAEVMYWLGSGYTLHTTHYYGDHKGQGGEFIGRVVAYHFVKE